MFVTRVQIVAATSTSEPVGGANAVKFTVVVVVVVLIRRRRADASDANPCFKSVLLYLVILDCVSPFLLHPPLSPPLHGTHRNVLVFSQLPRRDSTAAGATRKVGGCLRPTYRLEGGKLN